MTQELKSELHSKVKSACIERKSNKLAGARAALYWIIKTQDALLYNICVCAWNCAASPSVGAGATRESSLFDVHKCI